MGTKWPSIDDGGETGQTRAVGAATSERSCVRCHTAAQDAASHVVCPKMTVAFLNFQMERANDLITPRPEHRFKGLKPGDRWCVCALRWREAYEHGCAPPVVLECTHARALEYVLMEWLRRHAASPAPQG